MHKEFKSSVNLCAAFFFPFSVSIFSCVERKVLGQNDCLSYSTIGLKSDYTGWLFQVLFNLKMQHFLADAINSSSELPAATARVQHVSKQVVLSRILAVVFVFY